MSKMKADVLKDIIGFLDKKQGEGLKKHSPKFAALRVEVHHPAPPEGGPEEEAMESPAEAAMEGDDEKLLALAKKRGR